MALEAIFTHEPDASRRSCYDCMHCQALVSWWCVNEQARIAHGTALPIQEQCRFWAPGRLAPDRSFWEKLFATYVLIDNSGIDQGKNHGYSERRSIIVGHFPAPKIPSR